MASPLRRVPPGLEAHLREPNKYTCTQSRTAATGHADRQDLPFTEMVTWPDALLQEWCLLGHRSHLEYLYTEGTIQCHAVSGNAGRILKDQLFQSLYFMGREPRSRGKRQCVDSKAKASMQVSGS